MLVDLLALTLLQLAVGLALFDLVTPHRDLGGGFFALHGLLATVALALAALASGRTGFLRRDAAGSPSATLLLATFGAGLALHTLLANGGRTGVARVVLVPCAAAGVLLLASRVAVPPLAGRPMGTVWLVTGLLLGALLFGAVVWAMNLGHWYLVSRSLPFQLLVRGSEAFAALAGLRALFAVVALGLVAGASVGDAGIAREALVDPMRDGLFFWSRVLWGLVAPVALAPFVVKTARMRSNQAATGLLYVAVVFVLVGELLASYLTLRSGLPV